MRIGASVLRTGRGRAGGGGGVGGEVEFLIGKKFPIGNVPGVLKRKKSFFSLQIFFSKMFLGF